MLLIFSRNVGLNTWNKFGNLSREIKIYNNLVEKNLFEEIFFFTFDSQDKKLAKRLKDENILSNKIKVICPPIKIKIPIIKELYDTIFFLLVFFKISEKIKFIKTNQIDGSYVAVLLKIIFQKKLYLRSGYNILKRDKSIKANFIKKILNILQFNFALKFSDQISVSNKFDKRFYSIIKKKKTNLIYNYVDEKKFCDFKEKRNGKFLYLGRISNEKKIDELVNLFNKHPNIKLDLYGNLQKNIKEISLKEVNKNIKFYDPIANDEVPRLLNEYSFLILNSKFEGLSKVILESLSCGIFCIVSDLIENKFLIKNEKNGIIFRNISSINLNEIIEKEKNLRGSYELFNQKLIEKNFTFKKYLDNEVNILKRLS